MQKLCKKSHSNPGNKIHWPRACWRLAQSELLVPRKSVQSIQLHQAWALCAKNTLVITPWLLAPDSSFPTLPSTKTVQGAIPSKWLQTAVNTQHVPHWQPFPKTVIGNPPPFKTVSAAIQELLYPYLVPNNFTWLIKNLRGTWNECQSGLKKYNLLKDLKDNRRKQDCLAFNFQSMCWKSENTSFLFPDLTDFLTSLK